MHNIVQRSSAGLSAFVFSAASLAAQAPAACAPGSAFGIRSYQCANCSATTVRDSVHTVYAFGAEPVVLDALPNIGIKPGDVVVAVNGNPITTRAGADRFAYPPPGESVITVRRNGANVDVTQTVGPLACAPTWQWRPVLRLDSAGGRGVGGGRGGAIGGVGGVRGNSAESAYTAKLRSATCDLTGRLYTAAADTMRSRAARLSCEADSVRTALLSLDSVRRRSATPFASAGTIAMPETQSSLVELRNFALILNCRPSCTRVRARDGTSYWRFDGYPAVGTSAAVKDGLAAKAGIREGDVLISVNGLSPLSEEGALLLNRADRELTLNLEVSRAGKRERIALKL